MKKVINRNKNTEEFENIPDNSLIRSAINLDRMNLLRKNGLALTLAFICLIAATIIIVILLNSVKSNMQVIKLTGDQAIIITEMGSVLRSRVISISDYINVPSQATIDQYQLLSRDFYSLKNKLEPELESVELKRLLAQLYEDSQRMDSLFLDSIVPKVDGNNKVAADLDILKVVKIRSEIDSSLQKLRQAILTQQDAHLKSSTEAVDHSILTLIFCIAILILTAAFIMIWSLKSNERKYMSELTASEERLQLALWGAKAGWWDWQPQIRKLNMDERYAEIMGYELKDLHKQTNQLEEWIHPEDWPGVKSQLILNIKGLTQAFEVEYRMKNKAGDWVWLMNAGKVVKWDINGKAMRAAGIMLEITDRKQAEQDLARSRALYQGVFNTTDNAIILLDVGGLNILEANPAAQRISDYSLEELRQLKVLSLLWKEKNEVLPIIREQVEIALRHGSSVIQGEGKKKNGDKIPIEIHLSIIGGEEKDIVWALVFDLSEKLKYQEERRQRAQYEAQAQKMTTFSALSLGVVHEIAQPVNAIKVLAEGMLFWQEGGWDIDSGEAGTAFKNICIQAERINDIIMHMRNLSNVVEETEFYPCNVNEAVSGATKMLKQQLGAQGIRVELELDNRISLVRAQFQRMEEVVINLFINAMHALNERDQSHKLICCATRQAGERVILEVADNGSGISAQVGDQIWEPFFSTRKGGEGMGLGLSIVYSMVSGWGGSINYYNNEWGGATFRIELLMMAG